MFSLFRFLWYFCAFAALGVLFEGFRKGQPVGGYLFCAVLWSIAPLVRLSVDRRFPLRSLWIVLAAAALIVLLDTFVRPTFTALSEEIGQQASTPFDGTTGERQEHFYRHVPHIGLGLLLLAGMLIWIWVLYPLEAEDLKRRAKNGLLARIKSHWKEFASYAVGGIAGVIAESQGSGPVNAVIIAGAVFVLAFVLISRAVKLPLHVVINLAYMGVLLAIMGPQCARQHERTMLLRLAKNAETTEQRQDFLTRAGYSDLDVDELNVELPVQLGKEVLLILIYNIAAFGFLIFWIGRGLKDPQPSAPKKNER